MERQINLSVTNETGYYYTGKWDKGIVQIDAYKKTQDGLLVHIVEDRWRRKTDSWYVDEKNHEGEVELYPTREACKAAYETKVKIADKAMREKKEAAMAKIKAAFSDFHADWGFPEEEELEELNEELDPVYKIVSESKYEELMRKAKILEIRENGFIEVDGTKLMTKYIERVCQDGDRAEMLDITMVSGMLYRLDKDDDSLLYEALEELYEL